MLPTSPASFKYDEVSFKELDEMSTLENVLFQEFIMEAYSDVESQRVHWAPENADQVIRGLKTTYSDTARWAIYSGDIYAGFWFLSEHEDSNCYLELYLSPEFYSGNVDSVLWEVLARILPSSPQTILFNTLRLNEVRAAMLITYLNTNQLEDIVNCKNLIVQNRDKYFDSLVEQIKPYYVAS